MDWRSSKGRGIAQDHSSRRKAGSRAAVESPRAPRRDPAEGSDIDRSFTYHLP